MTSGDFMSVLHDLIPEATPSQKCRMNMGLILNGHGNSGIWNVACAGRHGHVHRHTSTPVALQLANSAVRLHGETRYSIKLWTFLHFPVKNI
jgi:hypothetical protein